MLLYCNIFDIDLIFFFNSQTFFNRNKKSPMLRVVEEIKFVADQISRFKSLNDFFLEWPFEKYRTFYFSFSDFLIPLSPDDMAFLKRVNFYNLRLMQYCWSYIILKYNAQSRLKTNRGPGLFSKKRGPIFTSSHVCFSNIINIAMRAFGIPC